MTVGALIGTAAHSEGKGCGVLDMAGLAQKGGSVWTHIKIAATPAEIHAARVPDAGADLLLGCDLMVTAGAKTRLLLDPARSRIAVNTHEVMPGEFTRKPDLVFPGARMRGALEIAVGRRNVFAIDATTLARALFGDTAAANVFMLGYAWQQGLLPVGADSIVQAIELNGVAVAQNKAAFLWGRRAAHDPDAVARLVAAPKPARDTLEDIVRDNSAFLTAYQDAAYAARYRSLIDKVRAAEQAVAPGLARLSDAVARGYFKLLAYKDEYEVARLYSSPDFVRKLHAQFEGKMRIAFNLAPPLLARRDPNTGVPRKMKFGPWLLPLFRILARGKRLRGTRFDPFGWTAERRAERELIGWYERLVADLIDGLAPHRYDAAVELALLPQSIRGFGHVKAAAITAAKQQECRLRATWQAAEPLTKVAS